MLTAEAALDSVWQPAVGPPSAGAELWQARNDVCPVVFLRITELVAHDFLPGGVVPHDGIGPVGSLFQLLIADRRAKVIITISMAYWKKIYASKVHICHINHMQIVFL